MSDYRARVQALECCNCGKRAPSHCHHLTGAGMALRASDLDSMPLCFGCHEDLHQFLGFFADKTNEERRDWQLERIAETRTRLGVALDEVGPRAAPARSKPIQNGPGRLQSRPLPTGRKLPKGRKISSRSFRAARGAQ